MEKRMMLAIVLSLVVILGYQYLFVSQQKTEEKPPKEAAGQAREAAPTAAPQETAAPPPRPGHPPQRTAVPAREITVRTPLYTAVVSTGGGGIRSFKLNGYADRIGPRGVPLEIVGTGNSRPLPLDLILDGSPAVLPALPVYRTPEKDTVDLGPGEKRLVVLQWESGGGLRVTREYLFTAGRYDFEVRAQIHNGSRERVSFRPGLALSQSFGGELAGDSYTFHGAVVDTGKSVTQVDLGTIGKGKAEPTRAHWAAVDSKYFALVLMPEKEWTVERFAIPGEGSLRLDVLDTPATLSPGESARLSARAFFGPKLYDLLKATGKNLEQLIDYGWFSALAKPLVWLLKASNKVTRNYGIDIILLTILTKVLFYPLTKKSMVSMKKMQELSPIINKIREKHKDDPQRMNQEVMSLYKTYKINPFSGCLPMLLQIPVFIALYKALLVTIELRHASFFLWINDLSAPEHLWDLSVAGYDLPIRLLPLLMGLSQFVQQKMTPSAGADPSQQKIMMFLPVIFTFMFWGFPTGLVVYWLANNLLSIGQQIIQNRQMAAEAAAKA